MWRSRTTSASFYNVGFGFRPSECSIPNCSDFQATVTGTGDYSQSVQWCVNDVADEGYFLPSISQPLVRNVLQRLALFKPAILLKKEAHGLILPIGRVVGAVRRQQNILQLVQRMLRGQRLVIKHI